jgi:hypothetical protein
MARDERPRSSDTLRHPSGTCAGISGEGTIAALLNQPAPAAIYEEWPAMFAG